MDYINFEADEESHISNSDDEFSLLPKNEMTILLMIELKMTPLAFIGLLTKFKIQLRLWIMMTSITLTGEIYSLKCF